MPTAMIKETQKQYRNEIVKAKAFFMTTKGSRADQKTAKKYRSFVRWSVVFWFFVRYCKGGWHAIQTYLLVVPLPQDIHDFYSTPYTYS